MAAVTYCFPQPLGVTQFGQPIVECRYFIADPALQGDGSGHDAKGLSVVVNLDPLDPFGWDAAIENAIIADAAAQQPPSAPYTVTSFRCLTPVYSDALLKESHTFLQPVTGFSHTMSNNVRYLLINPAGTLLTGTITMPGSPQNGRTVKICSSQTITALSHLPNAGQSMIAGAALTTLVANGFAEFIYRGSINTWFRTG